MNLHKMIEICLKHDNMDIFVMINALICINNYVITCINSMLLGRPGGGGCVGGECAYLLGYGDMYPLIRYQVEG